MSLIVFIYCIKNIKKINLNQGESYTNSPNSIKNKKATVNSINDDHKCFQYAATVEINCEEIERNSQGVSKIKPFINKQNSKGINFPPGKDDWKKFKKNNPITALNVLHVKK